MEDEVKGFQVETCFGGRKRDKIAYYGKNGGWN
jgi:hypothetical protein